LLDLRVAIFCEVGYVSRIVNPNRWRGHSWWPCTSSAPLVGLYACRRLRFDDSPDSL